jgi:hypothetical protein
LQTFKIFGIGKEDGKKFIHKIGPCHPIVLGELGDGENHNSMDTPAVKTLFIHEIHIYICKSLYVFLFILLSPLLLGFILSPSESKPMAKTPLGRKFSSFVFWVKGTLAGKALTCFPFVRLDFISLLC